MDDNRLAIEIKKMETYLREIKTSQKIGADSWILYRYKGVWSVPANTRRFLVFRSRYPTIEGVTRLEFDNAFSFQLYPIGARSKNGITFWTLPSTSSPDGFSNIPYIISSSQPGTVAVENVAPY